MRDLLPFGPGWQLSLVCLVAVFFGIKCLRDHMVMPGIIMVVGGIAFLIVLIKISDW